MSESDRRLEGLSTEQRAALERRLLKNRAQGNAPKKPSIARRTETGPAPLSFAQWRLWFLENLQPGTPQYNMPRTIRATGELDVEALRRALSGIVKRHATLRTVIAEQGDDAVQIIRESVEAPLTFVDLSSHPHREEELERAMIAEAKRPFDLTKDVLVRTLVAKLDDRDFGISIVMHHIASDGWSMAIFIRELMALYEAEKTGKPAELPELAIDYADYAIWQRQYLSGEVLEKQIAFWKDKLAGALTLEMPTDRSRPPVQSGRGARFQVTYPKALSDRINAFSKANGVTPFMTLMSAFAVLLGRYSSQEDISIGTPIAGRTRVETEKLIGFFVNTLIFRADLSEAPSFKTLLGRIKELSLGAFANQEVPFEKLVEELRPPRDTSRNPLFQVMFMLQNAPRETMALSGLELRTTVTPTHATKFDLSLGLSESEDGLRATLVYSTDLFDEATMQRFAGHYGVLLESILAAPGKAIGTLPILTAAEYKHLTEDFQGEPWECPENELVSTMFEEQARRFPDKNAVVFQGKALTYRELDERTNQLARYLRRLGVGPDARVGVCVERSLDMMIGVLATLKAGAAYVPIDPSYPAERVVYYMTDAEMAVVLTQTHLVPTLPKVESKLLCIDEPGDWAEIGKETNEHVDSGATGDHLSYVIYTSGSTGKPKGVQLNQRALANLNRTMRRKPGFHETDYLLGVSSLSFDIGSMEVLLPVISGGTVEFASRELAMDGPNLSIRIKESNATVMQATPASWRMLVESGWEGKKDLRIITGGEALSRDLADKLIARTKEVHDQYGPTETTIYSTAGRVVEEGLVTIGKPIANTLCYIVNRDLQLMPVGVPGELLIGGVGTARDYLKRPDLTEEKFIPNPFADTPPAERIAEKRVYRTADLVRWMPDGNLDYIGRIDHQVKIRGFRIELGEIEALLIKHPKVRQVVVVAREDSPGDKRLVAYLLAHEGAEDPTVPELRLYLKEHVPDYMVPSAFVVMKEFPLTPNKKVDRKALPKPESDKGEEREGFVAPRTALEVQIVNIWERVLNIKGVGVTDNFFELGGHSLLAGTLVRELAKIDKVLPLGALFNLVTVEDQAKFLSVDVSEQKWPTLQAVNPRGHKRPLFCISRPNVNALGYRKLSEHLGADQPVYGLQSRYREEIEGPYEPWEYEAVAKDYIREMRAAQPEGPYQMTGMCEGAHIGFEMVKQLTAAGQKVSLFAVLDAWPVENTRNRFLSEMRDLMRPLRRGFLPLKDLSRAEQIAYLREKSVRWSGRIVSKVLGGVQRLTGRSRHESGSSNGGGGGAGGAEFVPINERFSRRYWPGPDFVPPKIAAKITVLKVKEQPYWRINDPECGWGLRTTVGVDIDVVDGDHNTMLREPNVGTLAKKLAYAMEKAERGVSAATPSPAPSARV
jgi:amino acid adenylation domain-containing protein